MYERVEYNLQSSIQANVDYHLELVLLVLLEYNGSDNGFSIFYSEKT